MGGSTQLHFNHPVLLVGGGELDLDLLSEFMRYSDIVIAADGGANDLLEYGHIPHAVIGDMDSFDMSGDHCFKVIHLEEQETTDFEKCIYTVNAPLYIALGFTGKRLDHTMSSLHVLAKYHDKKQIVLADSHSINFVKQGVFKTYLEKNERFSVAPVESVHFASSEGLVYPLDDITLEMGNIVGTSNIAVGGRVIITPSAKSHKKPYLISLPKKKFSAVYSPLCKEGYSSLQKV